MIEGFKTLAEMATDLQLDRSGLRKWARANGFEFVRIRTPETRGQPTLALSHGDAERLYALREAQGYGRALPRPPAAVVTSTGYFYAISLIPDFDRRRIKLGFAQDVEGRLAAHRTAAPTAELIKAWPCRRTWEPVAIESVTRVECRQIGTEVFDCEDVDRLIERADAFFLLMPSLRDEIVEEEDP